MKKDKEYEEETISKLEDQNKALKKLMDTLDKKQKEIISKKQKHEKA
ncbi:MULTISPECIES: hypothetical protein [unclassified Lentimicrobium]|nr:MULTISPECIES: hypothetical protein [unclassified Lentimicrobium]NPD46950.1 hypothetical protein [Lentimicrobium sp. S6]NPD84715.1 hypothetical protein [Lentimicrobium sp. L6]